MTLRPIGENVVVMFNQADWEADDSGFVKFTGLHGLGYRLDGLVVATNRHTPKGIGVGTTVYGDPRKGRVIVMDDGTRYHVMRNDDLEAKAE